jgi:hypothetical protein
MTDGRDAEIWSDTFSAKGLAAQALLLGALTFILPIAGAMVPLDWIGWSLLGLALSTVWVSMLIWLVYLRLNVYYVLTSQRLVHHHGILTRLTRRIEVIDIDDVSVRQNLLERFIGVGTIEIVSSDRTDPLIELPGIDRVNQVAQLIDQARRDERVRRGMHIELV